MIRDLSALSSHSSILLLRLYGPPLSGQITNDCFVAVFRIFGFSTLIKMVFGFFISQNRLLILFVNSFHVSFLNDFFDSNLFLLQQWHNGISNPISSTSFDLFIGFVLFNKFLQIMLFGNLLKF